MIVLGIAVYHVCRATDFFRRKFPLFSFNSSKYLRDFQTSWSNCLAHNYVKRMNNETQHCLVTNAEINAGRWICEKKKSFSFVCCARSHKIDTEKKINVNVTHTQNKTIQLLYEIVKNWTRQKRFSPFFRPMLSLSVNFFFFSSLLLFALVRMKTVFVETYAAISRRWTVYAYCEKCRSAFSGTSKMQLKHFNGVNGCVQWSIWNSDDSSLKLIFDEPDGIQKNVFPAYRWP